MRVIAFASTGNMKVQRECRQISLPPIRIRRPIDILLEDVKQSKKPFVYHGRDIVKENARTVRFTRPSKAPKREVPAFSMQSKQKNVVVQQPKTILKRSRSAESESEEIQRFAVLYSRGDLPVSLQHNGGSGEPPRALRWKVHPRQLPDDDISLLLTQFSFGLGVMQKPLRNIAEWGVNDLLNGVGGPEAVLESLPHLVRGIRSMLATLEEEKQKTGLRLMVRVGRMVGPQLVPFYRQLLPPLRKVDQSWRGSSSLEMETENALNELEKSGGPSAFINIKYVLPYYESYRPKF